MKKNINFLANTINAQSLSENGIKDFEAIWQLDIGWYEEPNKRRGGWSGVSRYTLQSNKKIFIKRQENHCYRAWYHLFMPMATFYREFRNIQLFTVLGVPTLDLLYFGQRTKKGRLRAVLITQELEGFFPLDSESIKITLQNDFKLRKRALKKIAQVIKLMHQNRLEHNCLYEKHIFLKQDQNGDFDVRLIDLEKVKKKMFIHQALYRDLGTLYRHAKGWSNKDKLQFFLYYRNEACLSKQSKKILLSLLNKIKKKNLGKSK